MKIWIDLANSPHVLLFRPLIPLLESKGHEVVVSLRDFAQTISLAERFGIRGQVLGGHGGRSRHRNALNLLGRASDLIRFGRGHAPDLALSHNSYAQLVAARALGLRVVTMMDYEGQPANHLAFRLAHRVLVPESFPAEALARFGARPPRIARYPGFKEQIYLSDFAPSPSFHAELRSACGLGDGTGSDDGRHEGDRLDLSEKVLVTVRTPATMAMYHRFENPLFDVLLEELDRRTDVLTIVLPRTREQEHEIRSRHRNLRVPRQPLDGRELAIASDLVVSGGGTMNREAAVLGTPTCTIFAGKLPAVDRRLIELGRMSVLSTEADIRDLQFVKKRAGQAITDPRLADTVIDQILSP